MRRSHSPHLPWSPQGEAIRLLVQCLELKSYGRHLTADMLARLLVWTAVVRSTCNAVAQRLKLAVKKETLRKALRAALPKSIDTITDLIPASLSQRTLKYLRSRRRGFFVAIDLHHQPYYGKNVTGIFRGKAQRGTKKFWTVATAVIVENGHRLTLAVVPVHSNRMDLVLAAIWPHLDRLGVRVRRLLLDRGFYGAPVVHWLQERNIPFLMPMIRRGNARKGTGTTRFFRHGRTGFDRYRWQQRNHGRTVEVRVAMVPNDDRRKRPLVYIWHGSTMAITQVRAIYKRRFGIETSYREAHQTRGWTTSHDEPWRRLLQVLAFVIRNLWIQAQRAWQIPSRSKQNAIPLRFSYFLDGLQASLKLELQIPAPFTETIQNGNY